MKCDDCEFAEWNRTSNGRLHPNKGGRCKRLDVHPLDLRLPEVFEWGYGRPPRPHGGYIERGFPLMNNCIFKSVKRRI